MPSIDKGASEDTKTEKKSGPGATPGTPEKDPKDKPEIGRCRRGPEREEAHPAAGQAAEDAEHHPQPGSGPRSPGQYHPNAPR